MGPLSPLRAFWHSPSILSFPLSPPPSDLSSIQLLFNPPPASLSACVSCGGHRDRQPMSALEFVSEPQHVPDQKFFRGLELVSFQNVFAEVLSPVVMQTFSSDICFWYCTFLWRGEAAGLHISCITIEINGAFRISFSSYIFIWTVNNNRHV